MEEEARRGTCKKRLELGSFLRPTQKTGPGNKTTVTKHANYSIRLNSAFVNLPLKIASGDKSGHMYSQPKSRLGGFLNPTPHPNHPLRKTSLVTHTWGEARFNPYKIFFYFSSFVHETSDLLFFRPACIAHIVAILLHDVWAVYDPPSTSHLYAIHLTRLAMVISCKRQAARCETVFALSVVVGAAVPATVCRWWLCSRCPGVRRCLSGVNISPSPQVDSTHRQHTHTHDTHTRHTHTTHTYTTHTHTHTIHTHTAHTHGTHTRHRPKQTTHTRHTHHTQG